MGDVGGEDWGAYEGDEGRGTRISKNWTLRGEMGKTEGGAAVGKGREAETAEGDEGKES